MAKESANGTSSEVDNARAVIAGILVSAILKLLVEGHRSEPLTLRESETSHA